MFRTIALALGVLGGSAAYAAESGDAGSEAAPEALPALQVLPCSGTCANSTRAVAISRVRPRFPPWEMVGANAGVEGLVMLQFTVGVDGRTHDVTVEGLLGPETMERRAVAAIRDWVYRPATIDGKPVEQILRAQFRYVIKGPGMQPMARESIASPYAEARRLVHAGKLQEARAVLGQAQAAPRLNFYERTTIAFAMAQLDVQQNDDASAWCWLQLALLDDGAYLDRRIREPAMRLAFMLAAKLGKFGEALAIYESLKANNFLARDDSATKIVNDIRSGIAGQQPIAVSGRVPTGGPAMFRIWVHSLVRRTFGFHDVQGQLDRFQLACDQQAIQSAITQTAEWHVPASWSNCRVTVYGTAGTSFKLMEYN